MKLNINRPDFLKSWQIAERFTNGNILISASDEITKLHATDLKTSVSCNVDGVHVKEAGEALIPAALFGNMIRKAASDVLFLEVNSERGFLQSCASKMKFMIVPPEQFPKISDSLDAEEICEISADTLATLIFEGTSAASKPEDFPKYMGTCLLRIVDDKIKAVSTDGKRLAISTCLCEKINKNTDLLLPSQALKDLGRTIAGEKTVKISANASRVWFDLDNLVFSIQLIDASFPQYERILSDNVETSMNIKSEELIKVLERIDIIAKTTITHIMVMNLSGELKISTRSPEKGTASEVINAEINGKDMQVGFNVGYFLDGLKAMGPGDIHIEFSGEESQARITRVDKNDFLYMLMPTRLSAQDIILEEE